MSTSNDSAPRTTFRKSHDDEVIIFSVTLSVSHIVVEEFWPSLLYSVFSPHWDLHALIYALALLRSFCKLAATPSCSFIFSYSAVDMLLCLLSLSCWTNHALAVRWTCIWLHTLVYRGVPGGLSECEVPRSCGKASPSPLSCSKADMRCLC